MVMGGGWGGAGSEQAWLTLIYDRFVWLKLYYFAYRSCIILHIYNIISSWFKLNFIARHKLAPTRHLRPLERNHAPFRGGCRLCCVGKSRHNSPTVCS